MTGLTIALAACWTARGCLHAIQLANTFSSDDHADPHQAEVQADRVGVVRAHDDVVHVPDEPGEHHHRHVPDDEDDEGAHDEEVERPADLPVAGQLRIPREPGREGRRHRGAGQDRQGGQDEHDPEVRQLLERVVVVEAVWLRRQVEGGVVDEDGPGVGHDLPGRRHQALPLPGAEQQDHEDQAVAHPEQDAEEVPVPGHADRVPVAGQADPGGEVAGVVLCRPDAVLGHLDRREPEPLRAGGAVDVPVQPGVVHEDLQAAADEQDQEQEVDVVGDAQPGREAVRLRGRFGGQRGAGRQRRETDRAPLDVSRGNQQQQRRDEQQECLESNVHGHLGRIKDESRTV